MELTAKTKTGIETWIRNQEADRKRPAPLNREMLGKPERRAKLTSKLIFDPSLEHLKQATIPQTCPSYCALAAERVKITQWWSDYLDELNKSCLELDTATGDGL